MPFFTQREPPTVEAYRLPLNKETDISDSMWLWLGEKDMPARHLLQQWGVPGTWVVLSSDAHWSVMSDENFWATYKPLAG